MNIDIIRLTAPAMTFIIHIFNESFASSLHLSGFELSQTIQVTKVTRQILQPDTRVSQEWGLKTGILAARAQCWWIKAVLAESSAAIRALTGSTVTHGRAPGRRTCSLSSTLSVFQAWKAHLMGRAGCKQNSRRTAASQRSHPAQGEAFMPSAHTFLPSAHPASHTLLL